MFQIRTGMTNLQLVKIGYRGQVPFHQLASIAGWLLFSTPPTVFSKPRFAGFWISNISKNIRCRENAFRECLGFCVIFLRVRNGLLIRSPSNQTELWFFIASREPCVVCQKQVSRAGTSNYIPQILWDMITCPSLWYLFLHGTHIRNSRMERSHRFATLQLISCKIFLNTPDPQPGYTECGDTPGEVGTARPCIRTSKGQHTLMRTIQPQWVNYTFWLTCGLFSEVVRTSLV